MAWNRRRGAIVLLVLSCLYMGYCAAGYAYLRGRTIYELTYYAIYPGDIAPGWRLVPDAGDLARWTLEMRSPTQLREQFLLLPATLYSGTLGLRKYSEPLTEQQWKRAKELAAIFYRAGIPIGSKLVGPAGCSAVHQAVLEGDVRAANFLLALGKLRDVAGDPKATFPGCNEDVITFANSRGMALNPGESRRPH